MSIRMTNRSINCFVVASWVLTAQPLDAQLSERLKSESPAQLARDAREKGDAIRGAILFPQDSLGCTKCHAESGNDLLGPDLTRLSKDRTDEILVESILNPSKEITKGFETTNILTTSGEIYSGRLLTSANNQIILRENSDERKRLTFSSSEIDEVATGPKSLMPDGLVDQLKDRQQLLDLVRYLMQLRDSVTAAEEPTDQQRQELDPNLQAMVLIDRLKCANCHTNDLVPSAVSPNSAPRLTRLAGMLDPSYIEEFIADPLHTKPGTNMPDLLSSSSPGERSLVARQITHFLVSLSDQRFESPTVNNEAALRGRDLFHSIGCVACHSPRDDNSLELLKDSSVPLGALRYSMHGLVQFLEDPHAVRASGRMPDMKLDHWEATDLANYLLSFSNRNSDSNFQLEPAMAQAGQRDFQQLQCAICHEESKLLPNGKAHLVAPAFSIVQVEKGCLSGTNGDWPKFELDESEAKLIRNAISHYRDDGMLSEEHQLQLSMATFRCTSCHDYGTLGGIPDQRSDYFETSNPNLGPQGRLPPPLTGVGDKLNRKWMREVLISGRSIRPYIKTRMPQFGTSNVEHLIDLFPRSEDLTKVEFPEIKGREQQKLVRDAGHELVGISGLNCIACHTFQLKAALTMPAVDLTEMHERLKPDWFYHYMLEPKRFHRGTVMPAFWPGGRSVRAEILDGDTHRQITAIWEWMKDGRQARTPRGLLRQPMELLATNEAVMLRRSYPGIGKRGIGVGYPQLVNLAFDAEQMRIGLLWQGKFADPSGVWRGQGHGMVRPLAREQIKFLRGPELDDRKSPWKDDQGRPPKHQFKGYVLDELRRPKFLYQFENVAVEDYCVDASDSNLPMIRRTITLKSDSMRGGLAFRISPQNAITVRSPIEFEIGDAMTIRVQSPDTATILESEAGQQIEIAFDLKASERKQLILEYQWQAEKRQ